METFLLNIDIKQEKHQNKITLHGYLSKVLYNCHSGYNHLKHIERHFFVSDVVSCAKSLYKITSSKHLTTSNEAISC